MKQKQIIPVFNWIYKEKMYFTGLEIITLITNNKIIIKRNIIILNEDRCLKSFQLIKL